jgi:hypothetical protein
MTAVMRAVATRVDGPKALRVGLLVGGRVVDERLVRDGAVTVGESEDATLVVGGIGRSHRLFVMQSGCFVLHPPPGSRGRVALAAGMKDVPSELGPRVVLDVDARGKIVVGDATILFQIVDAPAPPIRPKLPLSVTTRPLDQIDWRLTILVVLSFLMHFGFVGSLYSDWTDPVLDESLALNGLVDMRHDVAPVPTEDPVPTPPAAAAPTATSTSRSTPASRAGRRQGGATHASDPTAGLVEAAERMRLGLIATTADDSPLADALKRSNIPPVDLEHADGSVSADHDLTLHASSPIDPGARRTDIGDLVNRRGDAKDHVVINDTPGPRFTVDATPAPGPAPISNAERTIASLRPGFRRCYELGLAKDASLMGDVTVRAKIRATGEVDGVSIVAQHGLSPSVVQCIAHKVELAQFDKQTGSGATLDVPVKFVRQ